MSQNNSQIRVSAASSDDEKIKLLQAAFAAASGLECDENGVFWVNTAKSLGVEFSHNGSYIYTYAVNAAGAKEAISASIDYDVTHIFVHNTSADGTAFAFGIARTTAYFLTTAIAKAENNEMMILATTSATAIRMVTSKASLVLTASLLSSSYITGVTMHKLAMMTSYTTFSELYEVRSAPSGTAWGTDSGIYVGGNLYKIISYSSTGYALAMKV